MYHHFMSCLVPDPWYKGRVVLVGDAAHTAPPHTGAVGSIAVEDAVVLAECMRQQSKLGDVLESYARRRFERCRKVVGYASEMCRYEQQLLAGPPDPVTFARLRADIQQAMGQALNVLGQQF
jgi:2-polyprenyl-6-methoxyphenol hydroxylase-like FAD-dependent oxidoreductase